MDISEIKKRIEDRRETLAIVERDIAEKKKELDDSRGNFSKLLLANVGGEPDPKAEEAKRAVISLGADFEGIGGMKDMLLSEIQTLQDDLKLASLFANEGVKFKNAMTLCEDSGVTMMELGKRLTADIAEFQKAVSSLFSGVERTISGSHGLLDGGLPPDKSVRAFLEDGTVTEGPDREAFLLETGQNLHSYAFLRPLAPELAVALMETMQDLTGWQRNLVVSDPAALPLRRSELRTGKRKPIGIDAETKRANIELATKTRQDKQKVTENLERIRKGKLIQTEFKAANG